MSSNVIAIESSYESSNADMGNSHMQIHGKQHNYLQDDEPLVEEITNTNLDDNGIELAIAKSQNLGVKTPDEWKVANDKERHKDRRTKDYNEYLKKLSKNLVTNKKKRLEDEKTSSSTRQKIRRELSYIEQNNGIPIYSALYYVGSVTDYDGKTTEQIKRIRNAKAETLRTYLNSSRFKELHPGISRIEIHYDERGDLHAQSQEVFVNKRKNGYADFAQRAVVKKALINRFGGGDKGKQELNRRLDLLCYAHTTTQDKRNIGDTRADMKYLSWALSGKHVKSTASKRYSQAERNTRIVELARIEDMYWLNRTAEKVFAKHGLNWKLDTNYVTNGKHKTASQYVSDLNSDKKLAETNQKLANNHKKLEQQANEISQNDKKLDQQRQQLIDIAKVKKAQQAIQQQQDKRQHELDKLASQVKQQQQQLKDGQQALDEAKKQLQKQRQRYRLTRQRKEKELQQRETELLDRVKSEVKRYVNEILKDASHTFKALAVGITKQLTTPEHANKRMHHNIEFNEKRLDKLTPDVLDKLVDQQDAKLKRERQSDNSNDSRTHNNDDGFEL